MRVSMLASAQAPYKALDSLSLRVEPGEVFGFLGPNGAGKTTTLKLLMQLVFPTSGRAGILGKPVGDLDVRRRIGYLPGKSLLLRLPHRRGTADVFRRRVRLRRRGTDSSASPACLMKPVWAPSAGYSCASSRKACCSASASLKR